MDGRVLVIERSTAVALMICGLLRRWGFEAAHEVPGQVVAPGRFDLVIADPADNGPRLSALREDGAAWLALMPAGAAEAGDADGWVVKPIRAEDLRAAVEACMGHDEAPGIDHAAIEELWGGVADPKFRMVAETFLGEMEQRLTAITEALAAEDRKRVLIEAHSVGSAAANVGGTAMSRTARELENAAVTSDWAQLRAYAEALLTACRRDLPLLRTLSGLETGR